MWCRKAAPCPPAGPAPAHAQAQESTSASCPRHQVVLPGCGRLQSTLRIGWEMAAAIRGRNDSRITPILDRGQGPHLPPQGARRKRGQEESLLQEDEPKPCSSGVWREAWLGEQPQEARHPQLHHPKTPNHPTVCRGSSPKASYRPRR